MPPDFLADLPAEDAPPFVDADPPGDPGGGRRLPEPDRACPRRRDPGGDRRPRGPLHARGVRGGDPAADRARDGCRRRGDRSGRARPPGRGPRRRHRVPVGRGCDAFFAPCRSRSRACSAWDRRVLAGVRSLRTGETAGYGEVARRIGSPGAARACGGAVGRNPVGLLVPCHRVIAGDGTLGGYGGAWPGDREALLALKERLLALEGVHVPRRPG